MMTDNILRKKKNVSTKYCYVNSLFFFTLLIVIFKNHHLLLFSMSSQHAHKKDYKYRNFIQKEASRRREETPLWARMA